MTFVVLAHHKKTTKTNLKLQHFYPPPKKNQAFWPPSFHSDPKICQVDFLNSSKKGSHETHLENLTENSKCCQSLTFSFVESSNFHNAVFLLLPSLLQTGQVNLGFFSSPEWSKYLGNIIEDIKESTFLSTHSTKHCTWLHHIPPEGFGKSQHHL